MNPGSSQVRPVTKFVYTELTQVVWTQSTLGKWS